MTVYAAFQDPTELFFQKWKKEVKRKKCKKNAKNAKSRDNNKKAER